MKPPKAVTIGPVTFQVEARELDEERDWWGETRLATQRILYNPEVAEDTRRVAILHEVLHALFTGASLQKRFKHEQEEEIIENLTRPLLDTLRRNPKLVEFLTEE